VPVGGLQQLRQVVEAGGDVGMLGPQALFVDGERASIKRFGLGEPAGGLQQLRQVVESGGVLRTIRPVAGLHGLCVALGQRDGLAVFASSVEADDTLVERFKVGLGLRHRRPGAERTGGNKDERPRKHKNMPHTKSPLHQPMPVQDTRRRRQSRGLSDARGNMNGEFTANRPR
jgi:hypothetical protein